MKTFYRTRILKFQFCLVLSQIQLFNLEPVISVAPVRKDMNLEVEFLSSAVRTSTMEAKRCVSSGCSFSWKGVKAWNEDEEKISHLKVEEGKRTAGSLIRMLICRVLHMCGIHDAEDLQLWSALLWYFVISTLYFGVYAGAVKYAQFFGQNLSNGASSNVVIVWFPPAGVCLAFCLWCGPACFPVIWGAELLTQMVLLPTGFSSGANVAWSFFKSLCFLVESCVLLCIEPHIALNVPLKALRFLIVVIVSQFTIGSIFSLTLYLSGMYFDYWALISVWVLGDVTGIVSITVLFIECRRKIQILASDQFCCRQWKRTDLAVKWAVLGASSTLAIWLTFYPQSTSGPRTYLLLLPLILAGLLFSVIGSSFLTLLLFIVCIGIIRYIPSILAGVSIKEFQLALFIFAIGALFLASERERCKGFAKKAAEAERLDQLRNDRNRLLEIVAHDIKTPLYGISGMLDSLYYSPDLGVHHRRCVAVAKQSCLILSSIVSDVLALRLLEETGLVPVLPALFCERELTRVLEDTVNLFYTTAKGEGLELSCKYSLNAWKATEKVHHADLLRLQQVLTNLVSNALKFTKEGSVCLELEDTDDAWFTIHCRDTGMGISRENAQKILFSRFGQLEYQHSGTGLGLHISKSIVEAMHGSLEVTSEIGQGSVFTLRFPKDHLLTRKESNCMINLIIGVYTGAEFFASFVASLECQFPNAHVFRIASLVDTLPDVISSLNRLIIDVDFVSDVLWPEIMPLIANIPSMMVIDFESQMTFLAQENLFLVLKPCHPSYLYELFLSGSICFSDHDSMNDLPRMSTPATRVDRTITTPVSRSFERPCVRILVVDDVPINRKVTFLFFLCNRNFSTFKF
jgi:signal transduction histidine kinase